jgi:outer membrane autotransporter protein
MFKKMLAIMALMTVCTTTIAEDRITVGVRWDDFKNDVRTQKNYRLNYDTRINDKLQLGLGVRIGERNTYDKNDDRLTNRYMVRINYEITDNFYINSAVGSKKQSLKPSTEFWQTEVGVKYRINDSWQVRAGYYFREGFEGREDDYSEGMRYRIQYRFNPRYNVSLQYDTLTYLDNDRNRIGINFQKRVF